MRFIWTPSNLALLVIELLLAVVWSPLGVEMRWKCKYCGERFDAQFVEMD